MFLIQLTNDSYSNDTRTRGPFDSLPTRDDVVREFGSIDSGDHNSQTYSVIDTNSGSEVGEITVYDGDDDETSWGCLK
jgi:hypothetical protein